MEAFAEYTTQIVCLHIKAGMKSSQFIPVLNLRLKGKAKHWLSKILAWWQAQFICSSAGKAGETLRKHHILLGKRNV